METHDAIEAKPLLRTWSLAAQKLQHSVGDIETTFRQVRFSALLCLFGATVCPGGAVMVEHCHYTMHVCG